MIKLRAPINVVTLDFLCWKCAHPTPVSSVRVHQVEDDGMVSEDVRIIDAEVLPDDIVRAVQALNPNYRQGFSRTADATYWANHCAHCGALQGDFFLNSEPDGPFFAGQVPLGASSVQVFPTGEWLVDAGYAF